MNTETETNSLPSRSDHLEAIVNQVDRLRTLKDREEREFSILEQHKCALETTRAALDKVRKDLLAHVQETGAVCIQMAGTLYLFEAQRGSFTDRTDLIEKVIPLTNCSLGKK